MTEVRFIASATTGSVSATGRAGALSDERVMQTTSYPFATKSGGSPLPTAHVAPATNTFIEAASFIPQANDRHAVPVSDRPRGSPDRAAQQRGPRRLGSSQACGHVVVAHRGTGTTSASVRECLLASSSPAYVAAWKATR
jgi:hypothetical protein